MPELPLLGAAFVRELGEDVVGDDCENGRLLVVPLFADDVVQIADLIFDDQGRNRL